MALPHGVSLGDFYLPTWDERALEWHGAQIRLIQADLHCRWVQEQNDRLARAADELDAIERKLALAAVREAQEKWWQDEARKGESEMAALMDMFQKQLDARNYNRMLARVEEARKDIERDGLRIERLELLRRGVVRGRRG
jgi:hypothetical protein